MDAKKLVKSQCDAFNRLRENYRVFLSPAQESFSTTSEAILDVYFVSNLATRLGKAKGLDEAFKLVLEHSNK